MGRRTAFVLVGIVLALATTGGWLARRAGGTVPGRDVRQVVVPRVSGGLPATPSRNQTAPVKAQARSAGAIEARMRCVGAWRELMRERISQLAADPHPDSQLAAALLSVELPPDVAAMEAATQRRQRALAWALELAPDDALVVAHVRRLCTWDDRCDASGMLEHLVRVDPDNTWTWIAVLERAQADGDEAGVDRAMQRAARSDEARSYLGQTALRIVDRFGELELPDGCASHLLEPVALERPATNSDWMDIAIGGTAWLSMPSSQPLLAACPPDIRDRNRRVLCIRSLEKVAGGEALLEQLLATSRLVQLTVGTRDGAAWRERYRNLQWLLAQASERELSVRDASLERWERGEAAFLEGRLRAANAWPAPPGWLPDGEQARSLVLTGRSAPTP